MPPVPRPSTDPWPLRTWVIRGLVGIAAIIGVITLGEAIGWAVAAGAAALAVLAAWPAATSLVVRIAGATVVATLGLVAFNVITEPLRFWGIAVGLVIAVGVYAFTAAWYLAETMRPRRAVAIGVSLAVVFVLGLPYAFGDREDDRGTVPARVPVRALVDVLIVVPAAGERALDDDGAAAAPPAMRLAEGEDVAVRWSVGVARGEGVRWVLSGSDSEPAVRAALADPGAAGAAGEPPAPRAGADAVAVLLPDGGPVALADRAPAGDPDAAGSAPPVVAADTDTDAVPGETTRWRRIATTVAELAPQAATRVVLRTSDARRVARWREALGRRAEVLRAAELEGATLTEASVRLALDAPTAHADLALAARFRPILLFDPGEVAPLPLSIDAMFRSGQVALCEDRRARGSACEPVRDPERLVNGGTHLELQLPPPRALQAAARHRPQEPGPSDPPSAIYVHPVGVERGGSRLLYLDYWWYLPYNPTGAGNGAFCGAGLVIPGITCFDHVSDWEGVTVVVDRTDEQPRPVAVHYAAHDSVTRHDWTALRERWDGDLRRFGAGLPDRAERPLVFVSSGTHASYPVPCRRSCVQTAHPTREEAVRRGTLGWWGNDSDQCAAARCVLPLPTRAAGTQPASWNAFDGVWGEKRCVWRVYCDSGSPPAAPGRQRRYRQPTRFNGSVVDGVYRDVEFAE